ncbi:hypothetical protein Ancab_019458 [Ancistrocladus abbreviatus]
MPPSHQSEHHYFDTTSGDDGSNNNDQNPNLNNPSFATLLYPNLNNPSFATLLYPNLNNPSFATLLSRPSPIKTNTFSPNPNPRIPLLLFPRFSLLPFFTCPSIRTAAVGHWHQPQVPDIQLRSVS